MVYGMDEAMADVTTGWDGRFNNIKANLANVEKDLTSLQATVQDMGGQVVYIEKVLENNEVNTNL